MKHVTTRQLAERVGWDQLFESEEELIDKMLECETRKGLVPRGYEYIDSFIRYYRKNGRLTHKQMIQLKRLSKSIYAFVNGLRVSGLVVRI